MALITCPECGREISSNAKTCPGCGCEITVCPDCNTVFANHPAQCPNCGHVFESKATAEQKEKQDDLKDYIKGKLSFVKFMQGVRYILMATKTILIVVFFVMLLTIPKDDPIEFIRAVYNLQKTLNIFIVLFCIIECIDRFIDVLFCPTCNILHKITANEMTLTGIDGAQYCRDNQKMLNNVAKKVTEWSFALNSAFRQDDKSMDKYNILNIIFGIILVIVEVVCIAIAVYPLLNVLTITTITGEEFKWYEYINFIALAIGIAIMVAEVIINSSLMSKYNKNLEKWCAAKSLPIKNN